MTNIAAYQAYIATNGITTVSYLDVTNIAAYQAYLATNGWTLIATNIAAYQSYLATNNYAATVTNIALYIASQATNGITDPFWGTNSLSAIGGITNTFSPVSVQGTLLADVSNVGLLNVSNKVDGLNWTNIQGSNVVGAVAEASHATNADYASASLWSTNIDIAGVHAPSAIVTNNVAFAVLSQSTTTNAPANNEFPVAGWVRGLFNNGILDYSSSVIDNTATNNDSTNVVYTFWQGVIPPSATRAYPAVTNGMYIGSVVTTNRFTFLQGPVEVAAYLERTGGTGGPTVTVHPEIYYSYDKTNWFGDWDSQNQTISTGTNLYQFVVSFPAVTATNSTGFYVERRFKVGTATGSTTPTVVFHVGTNTASGTQNASHIAFSGPNSAAQNPDGSTLTNLTLRYTTNAITAATFDWRRAYRTNIAGSFTCSIATPDPGFYESSVIFVTNSAASDYSITFPNGTMTNMIGGPAVVWCTNKAMTKINLEHYGQMYTNVSYAP